jgi:hypothetical protein
MADVASTVFVNHTQGPLELQVGNPHHKTDLATVEKDGEYTIEVAFNATYCEYFMGAVHAATDKKLVVSTDDCCDYKSITIKELSNGTFEVHKQPKSAPVTTPPAVTPTNSSIPSVNSYQSVFKFMGGYMKIIPKLGMNWRFWKQQHELEVLEAQ